jgi:hypothetical protein
MGYNYMTPDIAGIIKVPVTLTVQVRVRRPRSPPTATGCSVRPNCEVTSIDDPTRMLSSGAGHPDCTIHSIEAACPSSRTSDVREPEVDVDDVIGLRCASAVK